MAEIMRIDTVSRRSKVLVVDDEVPLQKALIDFLSHHQLTAIGASTRNAALHQLKTQRPDLVLLDINLGDDDGLLLLRDLRARSTLPVILMTGFLQDKADKIIGLESGADDYLLKPFDMRELVARIRANLRRREMNRDLPDWPRAQRFTFEGWVFDQRARTLTDPAGHDVHLTKSEFALLSTFVSGAQRSFSRLQLLQATRVHDEVDDRSIDVLILRLRRKLETQDFTHRLIKTQRGVGYIFDAVVYEQ